MSTVKMKISDLGAIVNVYKKTPDYGYIILESSDTVITNGWIRESNRTALLRAKTDLLMKFAAGYKSGVVPGRIVVKEFTEDMIPQNYLTSMEKSGLPYEDAIAPYLKRAGKDGEILMSNGKRIVRFTEYDPTGNAPDSTISHDRTGVTPPVTSNGSAATAKIPATLTTEDVDF
jgi:hypothetical protein